MNYIVLMTASNRDEARSIGRTLVEERLAACCSIIDRVESIYRWEGAVEESGEALAIIKTDAKHFAELEQRVQELHSYDVPEIIALPIEAGAGAYLRWLEGSLK